MSELRKTRKQNNQCEQCGAILDRFGLYCQRCNTMNNKSKFKSTLKLHSEGKCTDCGNMLDREGWFCKRCLSKSNIKARERNALRRLNGQCLQCAVYMGIGVGSYCRRCLDMLIVRRNRKNK